MNSTIAIVTQHLSRPGDVTLLLLMTGIILSWFARSRMAGITISTISVLIFLMIQYLPVTNWVTAPLENRFADVPLPSHMDGLIVLGGAVDPSTTLTRNRPTLNADAERMTEFVRLAKLHPQAKLVFAGGSGSLAPSPTLSEADVARLFFRQQGLNTDRVIFESRSQNTYENVVFAKALVHPRRNETWVLVSSAQDVPRCVAVFRKLQWPIIPRSVAFKSDADNGQDFAGNLKALDRSTHEWIGLLAYRLTGKSDELFPRPGG